jgi:hypothetical protein
MSVVGALFPDRAREAVKDAMAELGMTDEDLGEFLRNIECSAPNQ